MSNLRPDAMVSYETLTLDKIPFRVRGAISRYAMRHGELRHYEERHLDQMVYEINTHVLGKRAHDDIEIVEEPFYPSWRHQLVASLPDGFVRRWLTHFWGFEDNKLARQRRHHVSVEARCVFPDAEIVVPKETLGTPYRFAAIQSYAAWDPESEDA